MPLPPVPPQNVPRPLTLYTGAPYGESFTMYQSDGVTPVDLTGALFYSSMQPVGGGDVVDFTTDATADPTGGVFSISMPAATIADAGPGVYNYDVYVKYSSGEVDFMWGGQVSVVLSITVVP